MEKVILFQYKSIQGFHDLILIVYEQENKKIMLKSWIIGSFESYILEIDKKKYIKEFGNSKIKIKLVKFLVDTLGFLDNQLVI